LVNETIIVSDWIFGILLVFELPIIVVVTVGKLILVPVLWSPKVLEVKRSRLGEIFRPFIWLFGLGLFL